MTATKPSVGWYWVAGVLAIVGIIGAVVWGLTAYGAVGDRVDGFARAPLPGREVVPIDSAGTYAVFYEAVDTDRVPAFDIRVTDPDGAAMPVAGYGGDLRLEDADVISQVVATFDAPRPGDYVVTASGVAPGAATFAVGAIPTTGIAAVVGAIVLLFAAVGTAILIALVTFVLRNRNTGRQPPADAVPRTPAGIA
ncbi:MAG TPA: hypothetical protein VK923_12790 [Euzebyales bacterium]|nr:hypothetical protein [Euzebyales bacterium]